MTSTTLETTKQTTTSADGATIGYLSLGAGPGLIIVHGAMQSAVSQLDLARLLATAGHTVHLVQRRGRGVSGPYPAAGSVTEVEVADLAAVLAATGATDVFGVSSGAIIAARTALAGHGIRRLAIFEPPLVDRGSLSLDFMERFDREFAAADVPAMMTTAMLGAQMGPSVMAMLPRPVLRAITVRMLATDDAKLLPDAAVHLRAMAGTLPADFAVVRENAESAGSFAALSSDGRDVLLIAGTKTRPYLRAGVAGLAREVPGARVASLAGTNHGVTSNQTDWGKPELVAPVLAEFFG